jgi:hypothetical protein
VLKRFDEESLMALVNVKGLTPLKMLYRGVEALFLVLSGGVGVLIHRTMQIIKGDMPSILSFWVSEKENQDLHLGRDSGVSGAENEATKHDDAEVQTYLWNDRLVRSWRSLESPDDTINEERKKRFIEAANTISNKFVLPWWKRNVLISFMVYGPRQLTEHL